MCPVHDKLEEHHKYYQHPDHEDTYRPGVECDKPQEGGERDGGNQRAEGGHTRGDGEEDMRIIYVVRTVLCDIILDYEEIRVGWGRTINVLKSTQL